MATYYVSNRGKDSNSGSKARPWRTPGRVNGQKLKPGDRILFAGGQKFVGGLRFGRRRQGTVKRPIVVSSFGRGRATILAYSEQPGLHAVNAGGIRVENINFLGAGRDDSRCDGILFHNDLPGNVKLRGVTLDRLEVSHFGNMGILIQGQRGASGYKGVRITNCDVHDNRIDGIVTYGPRPAPLGVYSIHDLYLAHCFTYNQRGGRGRGGHSGSGIKLSSVNHGKVEHCVAYNNGENCDSPSGGPIGIWCYESNDILMQFCEAHHNHTDNLKDGGGFDFDGGVTNSVFQYNYSHDNDGAGYLICQFKSATNPFRGNVVRYNLSIDDGRKNGFGAVSVWGAGPGNDTTGDTDVYNNTFIMDKARRGKSAVINLMEELRYRDIKFRNNIFITHDGAPFVTAPRGKPQVTFQGNCYWAQRGKFLLEWNGKKYRNLEAWRKASGQEKVRGKPVGFCADPKLKNPFAKPTLDDTSKLAGLSAYRLKPGSPCIDAGLDLRKLFKIKPGKRDYYGNKIPRGKRFDVGAHEY